MADCLSAGQRRRTALAGLLARRAEVWLLDEPHAGLDTEGRDELDTVLRSVAANGGTVIVASHELDRANALATRTVAIAGGALQPDLVAPGPTSRPVRDQKAEEVTLLAP